MSNADARSMIRIALFGALAALFVDWFLRPALLK